MTDNPQIKYYQSLLAKHGNIREVAGWGGQESQVTRFEVFCQQMPLTDSDILDVGCGRGDFLDYLKSSHRVPKSYTGVELIPEIARYAQTNHSEASIVVGDLAEVCIPQVDYAMASGIFNLCTPDHDTWMKGTVERMFQNARKGVAFNVLSRHAPKHLDGQYYADPSDWLGWCLQLTPFVIFRHDYAVHDVTFFLFHEVAQ